MKKIFLILTIISSTLFSQENTFEHIYGKNQEGLRPRGFYSADIPECLSVDQDSEGNFVLINSFGYLIKTNPEGDILWIKQKADVPPNTSVFRTPAIIKNSSDSTYILSIGSLLMKLDYSGETIWQYQLDDYFIYSFLVNNSGEILTGSQKPNTLQIRLTNFSAEGDSIWGKELLSIATFPPLGFPDIVVNDSTIYLSSNKRLFALDPEGNMKWQKDFTERILDISGTPENLYACFAADASARSFNKLDFTGDIIWTKDISCWKAEYIPGSDKMIVLGYNIVHLVSEDNVLSFAEPDMQNTDVKVKDNRLVFCGNTRGQMRLLRTDYNYFYKGLTLTYPSGYWNDNYLAGDNFYLNYKATDLTVPIIFEYSADKGNSWDIISSNLPAADTSFNFSVPVIAADTVLLRLRSDEINSAIRQTAFTLGGNYEYIHVNNVKMWISNTGDGSHNPYTDSPGFYWPDTSKTAVFEDGLVFGGKVNGEIKFNGNTHRAGLVPGTIISTGLPDDKYKVKYSVWKLKNGWENLPEGAEKQRYQLINDTWPVEMGAPYRDINGDGVYSQGTDKPGIGDETLFYVSNELDTMYATNTYGTYPIGLEFQTSIFGFEETLQNVVYKRYTFINKSGSNIEDMYLGYWSDPDLGDHNDDYAGVDSTLSLSFCYNYANTDQVYGTPPPAVGYKIIQGPVINGGVSDSAIFKGKWIKGYRNLSASAFCVYMSDPYAHWIDPVQGVPEGASQFYNNLQGYNWDGSIFINPVTSTPTKFVLNGDPYRGTGWYEGAGWPGDHPRWGDRRFVISTGPFTMLPGDTQEVVIAAIAEVGDNYLHSIEKLKQTAAAADKYYKSQFTAIVGVKDENMPLVYSLSQNYPNPFNPATKIKYQIPVSGFVTIKIFDILGNEVVTLVNEELKAGNYEVNFNASKQASSVYIYQIKVNDFAAAKKMVLIK